ncbi:hypothetical protein AB0K00_46320 [Dactylosporangium sp. NPDC049525]|uniref:hypothetical protein n=1 Tax=Dactylosporangium sp. NPDC049525 TaxID=3154730 RepID=UPI00344A3074
MSIRERMRETSWQVGVAVVAAVLAVVGCALAGLSPWLPPVLALLGYVLAKPFAGLVYVAIVATTSLGLWATGVEHVFGAAFGGREYLLDQSIVLVVLVHCTAAAVTVLRGGRPPGRGRLVAGGVVCAVLLLGVAVGVAHHSVAQSLLGVRYVVFPLLLLGLVAAQPARDRLRFASVLAWLLVANGVAALLEVVLGPGRLAAWGLDHGRAIRYIDGNFRAPGLTDFNADLGMLAGAYLLGYVGLWLDPASRPRQRSWHAGAIAAGLCLALSTSRSGAVLLAGGVIAAVVLNRGGGAARRRQARFLGLGVLALVAAGFVTVGATGATSLFQRFDVWADLLRHDLPWWGRGVGAAGAASNSRFAHGEPVFVDNYYVSLALQFGPVVALATVVLIGVLLVRLARDTATRPAAVVPVAVLAGLAASFLVLEAWEYDGAMLCLAAFVVATTVSSAPVAVPTDVPAEEA